MLSKLPKRIIYTRHPQCLHNVDHEGALRQGIENRNSPLTDVGEMQSSITAEYLRKEFPDISKVFCSTYSRTKTIPISAGYEKLLSESPLLDERSMGVWHRYLREEVLKRYPDEDVRIKTLGYYAYEAPEGESCTGVEERLNKFLLLNTLGELSDTIYISGHGISGLCLRRLLTGASVEDWHSWDRLKNASVSIYERHGSGYICSSYNLVPWEGVIDPALLIKKSTEA